MIFKKHTCAGLYPASTSPYYNPGCSRSCIENRKYTITDFEEGDMRASSSGVPNTRKVEMMQDVVQTHNW